MPFFSIIIPLYNKEKYILNALESIKTQSFNDYEVIVVDDGSTDKSYEIVSNFNIENIVVIKQENKGVASARNKGIALAKGKYIALLDADDIWYNNHLEELKKQIDLFPEAKLFCNNYEVALTKTIKRKASFNFECGEKSLIVKDYFKASCIDSVAWTSAVAFPKQTFLDIGQFNTSFTTCEDLDLWIRMALQHNVSFNPKITALYNIYLDNNLTKNKNHYKFRIRFINSHIENEKKNFSLKLYLDINRYALIIQGKILKEEAIVKQTLPLIKVENLNYKQRFLLKSPRFIIIILKTIQRIVFKKGLYISAFK